MCSRLYIALNYWFSFTYYSQEMPESHNLDARDQQNPQEQIQSDAHQVTN